MLVFPASPSLNQRFPDPPITGEAVWYWDGQKWVRVGLAGENAVVVTAADPPVDPLPDTLWFDTDDPEGGALYIYYDDGDSMQYVSISRVGPQGDIGPQGEQGIQGEKGDVGSIASASDGTIDGDLAVGADLAVGGDLTISGGLTGSGGTPFPLSHATNALTASISMPTASVRYTGPQVNVGTEGIWFVTGTIGLNMATTGQHDIWLTDGTTTFASMRVSPNITSANGFTLCGICIKPAGPLRITVSCTTANATINFNNSLGGFDTQITAVRIG